MARFGLCVQAVIAVWCATPIQAQDVVPGEAQVFVLPPEPADLPPDLQVYARFTAIAPLFTGDMCPSGSQCIFGGGGGVAGEIQRRWPSGWSASLGYGWSFLDGGGVFEIGVLQQLRLGFVRAFLAGNRLHPFVGASLVGAGFGDSFAVETVGGGMEVSGGMELELTAAISIYASAALGGLAFSQFKTLDDGVERAGRGAPVTLFSLSVGLAIVQLR